MQRRWALLLSPPLLASPPLVSPPPPPPPRFTWLASLLSTRSRLRFNIVERCCRSLQFASHGIKRAARMKMVRQERTESIRQRDLSRGLQTCNRLIQKKRRRRFLESALGYLRSDSYMYGPLLSASLCSKKFASTKSPMKSRNPSDRVVSRPQKKQCVTVTDSVVLADTTKHYELGSENVTRMLHASQSPTSYVSSISLMRRRCSNLRPNTLGSHGNADPSGDREALSDPHHDSQSWSATESYAPNQYFRPLSKETAEEVAQRLVQRLGGRYSKELGIYIDIHDSEVERWFLAATLITNPGSFSISKIIFKKLQDVGVLKVRDILSIDHSYLADMVNTDNFEIHKHRMASRLQRLANVLQRDYKGRICSLKNLQDYSECKRELQNLPGFGGNACRIFLREMRGVWPAATPEVDKRTKNAAMHLHLLPQILKDSRNHQANIFPILKRIAEGAGLDARDLEVALCNLGFQHARNYGHCVGGTQCSYVRW